MFLDRSLEAIRERLICRTDDLFGVCRTADILVVAVGRFSVLTKHCQRHNGPEGCVLVAKVTSLGHITSFQIDLDQISFS